VPTFFKPLFSLTVTGERAINEPAHSWLTEDRNGPQKEINTTDANKGRATALMNSTISSELLFEGLAPMLVSP
jgi:hypothetical protein